MPESFRWYYAHDKIGDAEKVITMVSEVNRHPKPDMAFFENQAIRDPRESQTSQKYTVLDLFKTKSMIRITVLLAPCW